MKDIKRILVVSRATKHCEKTVHYAMSLAQKYGAQLFVVHVMHNPFVLEGWNLAVPSLDKEYARLQQTFKNNIDRMIEGKKQGFAVKAVMKEGNPCEEIIKMVKEENIDLLILLAHEEGHFEHFLFGRDNEDLIRKMPCSIMLVKKEPDRVA